MSIQRPFLLSVCSRLSQDFFLFFALHCSLHISLDVAVLCPCTYCSIIAQNQRRNLKTCQAHRTRNNVLRFVLTNVLSYIFLFSVCQRERERKSVCVFSAWLPNEQQIGFGRFAASMLSFRQTEHWHHSFRLTQWMYNQTFNITIKKITFDDTLH